MTTHPSVPEGVRESPKRIQLRRMKGWRMPPNTVKVDRSTNYGNPFTHLNSGRVDPVLRFRCEAVLLMNLEPLRGRNLACWCRLCIDHQDGKPLSVDCDECETCHGDVLLELSNQ